jgi:hypothetical protein
MIILALTPAQWEHLQPLHDQAMAANHAGRPGILLAQIGLYYDKCDGPQMADPEAHVVFCPQELADKLIALKDAYEEQKGEL